MIGKKAASALCLLAIAIAAVTFVASETLAAEGTTAERRMNDKDFIERQKRAQRGGLPVREDTADHDARRTDLNSERRRAERVRSCQVSCRSTPYSFDFMQNQIMQTACARNCS